MQIKCFINDNFRTLSYLYDIKGEDNRARITQQEVADALGISRSTLNKIMNELKKEGYVEQDGNYMGRYIVTNAAISVIETFRSIDKNDRGGTYDGN